MALARRIQLRGFVPYLKANIARCAMIASHCVSKLNGSTRISHLQSHNVKRHAIYHSILYSIYVSCLNATTRGLKYVRVYLCMLQAFDSVPATLCMRPCISTYVAGAIATESPEKENSSDNFECSAETVPRVTGVSQAWGKVR